MSFDQLSSMESGGGGGGSRNPANNSSSSGPYSDNPEFSRLSQNIANTLFHLQGNNDKIRTEINKLGTRQDNPRLRERVQTLLDESHDQFKEVGAGVKKLQRTSEGAEITKSQKYSLQRNARELETHLKEFQQLQRTALEKQRASVSAARAALADEQGQSPGDGQQGEQQLLQLQQQQQEEHLAAQDEVDFQDALIQEREEEIRHIEEGVGDLNVLFRQVAQIVSEQGEQLETIEGNAIQVRDDTQGADYELRSAARYQKNARSKACCLLLILAVILTIVLLAVFLG